MMGIYAIRNLINGKTYIGQSLHIVARMNAHRRKLIRGLHHSAHLQNAFNKDGKEKFAFFHIEIVNNQEKLVEREQFWMDLLKTNDKRFGYNNGNAGFSTWSGRSFTEDHKDKISKSSKGRIVSEETRNKIRLSNTGKKHTEETKLKFRQVFKGRKGHPPTEENRRKISLRLRGTRLSDEHRKKLSDSHKGYRHTPEQKAKISTSLLGIKRSEETRLRMVLAQKKRRES
jgi:group I intron endonuclease